MKVVVKVGERVFEVDIENTSTRPIIATVEGERFEVFPETTDLAPGGTRPETALSGASISIEPDKRSNQRNGTTLVGKTLTSPLPGVVIEVFVKPGEHVEAGHVVLVIEAMKMKNSIRTTRAGTIAALLVNAGETVAHKQPLVEFSE